MGKTKIEWATDVWNPVRGCSMAKGSETGGCLNCYAARMSARNLPGMNSPTTGQPFAIMRESGPRWTGKVELIETHLLDPLKWRTPKKIFVNSMSDLWHESLKIEDIARVYAVMAIAQSRNLGHVFQVLTKRPEVRLEAFNFVILDGKYAPFWESVYGIADAICSQNKWKFTMPDLPLANVWEGVSVEDQKTANMRILPLLNTPAAVRFLSYEPALGPIDLEYPESVYPGGPQMCCSSFECGCMGKPMDPPMIYGLDWVIAGGESGPGARPVDVKWLRSVRDQCARANVPFFFKQWGGVRKKAAGRLLDGREHSEFPQ